MFQNINEETIEINNKAEKAKRNVNIFSNVLTKENLAIYVVAFMMSLVGIGGDFSIFSISVLGACFASSVPALGVVAVSLLGNFIKFGVGGGLGYFLTAIVLIITLFTPNLDIGLPDISIMSYYQNFPSGVIALKDVVGPLTLAMMFIAFTIIVMQRRKLVK